DSPLPVSGTVKRLDQMHVFQEAGTPLLSLGWFLSGVTDTAFLLASNALRFFSGWVPPSPWSRLVLAGCGVLAAGGICAAGAWSFRRTGGGIVAWLREHVPASAWVLVLFTVIQA